MSEREVEHTRKRSEILGEDRDRLFSELETRFLTIVRSRSGDTLPRKAIREIESLLDDYYKRWKK